jgi:hypothetical protein
MAEKMSLEKKIEHFLRLAEDAGATEAERETARKRAEDLMVRHGIERAMLDPEGLREEEIVIGKVVFKGGGGTYAESYVRGFYRAAEELGLKAWQEDNTWVRKGSVLGDVEGPHRILAMAGYRSDVDAAKRLIHSLAIQALLAMKDWQKNHPDGRLARAMGRQERYHASCEFLVYFGLGVAHQLQQARADIVEEVGNGAALVLVERSERVRSWVSDNVGLKSVQKKGYESGLGRGAGWTAGQRAQTGQAKELGFTKSIGR